jgi:hypothetical protein
MASPGVPQKQKTGGIEGGTMFRISCIMLTAAIMTGCTTAQPTYHTVDADRILDMAGQEAGQIHSPYDRLSRQLNIANRETTNGHDADARATLVEARKTLESAGKGDLTDHQRLAGWISLSELNRNANDRVAAGSALDKAIDHLNQLLPVSASCDYVIGVADEINALRGQKESAKLIAVAGDWAVEISDQSTRRQALAAFTEALFRCDDYDAARKMLRYDTDAAWRSDQLVAMSDQARNQGSAGSGGVESVAATPAHAEAANQESSSSSNGTFGKRLDFRSNFYSGR